MSGPNGQLSKVIADESSLNKSATASEFTDLLSATAPYFDAWLESIKPALASEAEPVPVAETYPPPSHVPGSPTTPGEFRFEGTLCVDGYVTGRVRSETGTLVLTEAGEADADLFVAVAIVDGLVRGDIRATERVELGRTARVFGNIETPSLAIQPGAVFEGHCHFGQRFDIARQEENPESAAEKPTLSLVTSGGVAIAHEAEIAEAEPLAAVAGC